MKKFIYLIPIVFAFACNNYVKEESLVYPVTKKADQVDNYFGVDVADPYRWLEDDMAEDVKSWVEEQNKVTFGYLNNIPFRNKIKDRLSKIWNYPRYSAPAKRGDRYFFYKNDGLQNQSVLYIQESLDGKPEVFLDPNTLSDDGTKALTEWSVSNDGKYFAYGIAVAGSDWRDYFVIDLDTREKMTDHIQWIKFSGVSWYKDGFYYSRFDEPKEGDALKGMNQLQKVYYHKLGTEQADDELAFKDDDHPKRGNYMEVTDDEKFLLLYQHEGAGHTNSLYCKSTDDLDGEFIAISDNFDNNYSVLESINGQLLVKTNKNAPKNRLVMVDPSNPSEENWIDVVPEEENVIESANYIGGKIIVQYMKDAYHEIYSYGFNVDEGFITENKIEIELPTLGSAFGFGGKPEDSLTYYTFDSFVYPSVIYEYNVKTNESKIFRESEVDFNPDDYETKLDFYKSKDGTDIPLFIVHKKGLELNGNNPTLVYGYGGFNVNLGPAFRVSNVVLLENGGVYALAILRGGGEYGEEWHKAGMRLNKQNVFDDFISAGEYLISEKYTSKERLAILGGSNGGLLVGACMLQRPDLFKVAFPAVGVMDMLRFHKFTIGHAWVAEYGSSDDSVQFNNLYKFSPVHNVKEGVQYPATMVTTADHDDRVVPAHSFKYIAALQDKQQGSNPVMIRIETKAGHGAGKPVSKRIEEQTDMWSFMFHNMGVTPIYN